jgi:hypothetical protein
MTVALAIEYIPRRMKALGYNNDYNIRFRHFVLQPKERKKIHADNQLFILIEPNDTVSVKSDFGIYDLAAINVNELQYEHQGNIRIRNYAGVTQHIRFIQVIPKETNNASK